MSRKGSNFKVCFSSFFLTSKTKPNQTAPTPPPSTRAHSKQPAKLCQIKEPISDGVSRPNYLTVFF